MITLAGHPTLEMRLTFPQSGLWVASLAVDTDEVLTGAVTLAQGDTTFAGYVVASGVVADVCRVQLVGGAGGLPQDVEALSYREATARTVAGELLAAVGESLDVTSTRAALSTLLPFWTRAAGRASLALSKLAEALDARWRVLPSGSVWVGSESWPEHVDDDAVELDRDARSGEVLLAAESLTLLPGMLFRGDQVGRVEHHFSDAEHLRTTYWIAT